MEYQGKRFPPPKSFSPYISHKNKLVHVASFVSHIKPTLLPRGWDASEKATRCFNHKGIESYLRLTQRLKETSFPDHGLQMVSSAVTQAYCFPTLTRAANLSPPYLTFPQQTPCLKRNDVLVPVIIPAPTPPALHLQ